MSASREIKNLIDKQVENLLRNDVRCRDNDKLLVARIWTIQLGGKERILAMSAFDFLVEYSKDKNELLYNSDSITRARRKLQELDETLRGKSYEKRHNETKSVKKVLRNS
jgi:hypothetical protein